MSVVHPSPQKVEALRRRWEGQTHRLEAIARDLRAGCDWTAHLRGLPYVDEIPPLPGEAYGRDLRGANLQKFLRPEVAIWPATEREAALVAGISLEGLRNNTALPDASPFAVEVEGAAEIALAMRRGERFLLARCDGEPVGVVRLSERREFQAYTGKHAYLEISGLAVLPRWRRTGIGAQLLQAAEQTATRLGHPWVLLRTTFEVGLVPWYRRHGYTERHVRQLSYPQAPTVLDVVMTKPVVEPAGSAQRGEAPSLRLLRTTCSPSTASRAGAAARQRHRGAAGFGR